MQDESFWWPQKDHLVPRRAVHSQARPPVASWPKVKTDNREIAWASLTEIKQRHGWSMTCCVTVGFVWLLFFEYEWLPKPSYNHYTHWAKRYDRWHVQLRNTQTINKKKNKRKKVRTKQSRPTETTKNEYSTLKCCSSDLEFSLLLRVHLSTFNV